MNWRRGLWRLWIVLSVLWVAGASLSIADRLSYAAPKELYYSPISDALHQYRHEFAHRSWELDLIDAGLIERVRVRPDLTLIVFTPSKVEGGERFLAVFPVSAEDKEKKSIAVVAKTSEQLRPRLEALVEEAGKEADRIHKEKRDAALKEGAMTALIPPLAVALLGLVVGWVLKGFRKA